jgi:hypothetical protein
MQNTIDLNKYLIQTPYIAQLTAFLPELITILATKLYAPFSNSLVTNADTSGSQ